MLVSTYLVRLFLTVLFLAQCGPGVEALIPEQCVHNVTRPFSACCPQNPHNHLVCGGPERGFCQKVAVPKEYIPNVFHMDDRLSWPLRFFSHACQCKGNFFGSSCEHCWFGWTGPHCDIPQKRIRRDIRSLSDHELFIFKDVMRRSQTWPSGYVVLDESDNFHSDPLYKPRFIPASVQYFVTFNHRYGSRATLYKNKKDCEMYGILNFNHDGVVFPTWHRYFQLIWERLLGEIALKVHHIDNFAAPYWDFIGLKWCDVCNNRFLGGSGRRDKDGLHISQHSTFANFTEFCFEPDDGDSCFGCQRARRLGTITREFSSLRFPDQRDLDYVLSLKNYFIPGERDRDDCKSFHMALEGYCGRPGADKSYMWMHNQIHRMINGSMCCASTATNDPMFIVLHNFVDKIFTAWFRLRRPSFDAYPNANVRPGHSRDSFMIGLFPLARNSDMFVDSRDLGYDYDDMVFGKHANNNVPPIEVYVP